MGTSKNVVRCSKCPDVVREEIRRYVEGKKDLKRQMLHRLDVTNLDDDDDEEMEEGEVADLSLHTKSQKQAMNATISSSCGSTGRKGPLDCYFPQKSRDDAGKNGKTSLQDVAKGILRERAVAAFSRWVYDAGLPFNCVNYTDTFGAFIEAIGQCGPGIKPPTYHKVSVSCLAKEVEETQKIVEEHRVEWNKFGCSIMMDKWTARTGKMIINVLVNSPKGSLFLESINASDSSTDSIKIFSLFQNTIEKIGAENVVQVVTDNAAENVKAGDMLKGVFPHIYWTPCAAHCINLIFGDIFKEKPFTGVFTKAVRVHSYIVQRPLLLNMMRRFTKQKNLVTPGKTRFATAFLTLHSMYTQKANLRSLFISEEWNTSKFAKEVTGKEVEQKPPMGYIYEAMDRAKGSIQKAFTDEYKYAKVFEIIDKRWNTQLHQHVHAAGNILNPSLFYDNVENNLLTKEVWKGFHKCVAKLVVDEDVQDSITDEISTYRSVDGLFGLQTAIRQRMKKSPVEWWRLYGLETPELQKFAIKVLSLTCSSSGCERNWSVFEHLHTKKRNRLTLKRLNGLVFIKYNRTLRRRYNARNVIDPIRLDNIDDANEWLTGGDSDFTWGVVGEASGVEENRYDLRGNTSSSHRRGKEVATSLFLVDEVERDSDGLEEDDEQYNDNGGIQDFDNLVVEEL
ncbi:hypothetical protein KY290_005147 [Solanum tuberosum]|uniref:Uncharacterized protein n=1 Tax=Solanum tuberosum TaxID=4113 RepID=A0ABQ7WD95_SOLTU|nr:hypothetical protein KY289_005540 [Solanum tuberosum]KAH0751880.1 hypothetical protein KY285_005028 [Solanum tuberosum]KAH0778720.1 hypothetical protein KY290_005147 [Solanum tuberosum]